jgi:diguanylate cyclase (GGDEF)-like protein
MDLSHQVTRLLGVIETQNELAGVSLDLDEVMRVVARRAAELTGADAGVVELPEGDEMVYRAASGTAQEHLGMRLAIASSLSGLCVTEGRTLRCDDTADDDRVDAVACTRIGARSMLCVPLRHGEQVNGVLKVYCDAPGAFDGEDIVVLEQLSGVIAAHMRHAAEFERKAFESRHDVLTDIGNRRGYDERLQKEIARARRYGQPLSLVLLDLDGFKAVNDDHGHPAGDEVLRRVGAILRGTRTADECFRVGGDEFAILLPATPAEGAARVAERVEQRIADATAGVTATTAAATWDGEEPDSLHAAADATLVARKRAGRR